MKKIFVFTVAMSIVLIVKAQPDIVDSSQLVRVADKILLPTDFNVLLSKSIRQDYNANTNALVLRAYAGFVDTSLDNTYKKINDSTYDIYINNPCKDIFLVYNNLDWHYYNYSPEIFTSVNLLSADNSAYILSRGINRISYKTGDEMITYDVLSFNPFVSKIGFFLYKVKNLHFGYKIREFIFHYNFPKPLPIGITTDKKLIAQREQNPSTSFGYAQKPYNPNQKFDAVFKKDSPVLFIFEHFARSLRSGYNDLLQYKLDSATNWSYTPLSYTPSVLLQNLSTGKHTLYVKYPSDGADILEYHFQIVPN